MVNKKHHQNLNAYFFLLPALIIFSVFFVLPVCIAFYYSLTSWNGYNPVKQFIGLKNYVYLFTKDIALFTGFKNNLKFILAHLLIGNTIALLFAVLFNSKLKFRNFYRGIFFTPVILSTVAAGYIWSFIYDPSYGLLNSIFKQLNLPWLMQNWLGDYKIALNSIIVADIWKACNFNMILFLAGLQSIPMNLYESAAIDGADGIKKFFHITIPLLKPTIFMVTLLTIIGCLKSFDMVYVMTGGGPGYSTELIATRLVNEAFSSHRIGYASAQAFALFVLVFTISLIQLLIQRKRGGMNQ